MRTNESREDLRVGASRLISVVRILGLILGLGAVLSRPAHAEVQNDLVGFSPTTYSNRQRRGNIDVMSGNPTKSF